jgi:hypothetical protein
MLMPRRPVSKELTLLRKGRDQCADIDIQQPPQWPSF